MKVTDSKFPPWLWLLIGMAIVIAFVSAHFFYGNIWMGFVIVLVELIIAAVHFGASYAWSYFFD